MEKWILVNLELFVKYLNVILDSCCHVSYLKVKTNDMPKRLLHKIFICVSLFSCFIKRKMYQKLKVPFLLNSLIVILLHVVDADDDVLNYEKNRLPCFNASSIMFSYSIIYIGVKWSIF